MSEIDPPTDTPLVNWSELGVTELLPTGTVTLLLADVEGSTRLWQTQPEVMTAALAELDRSLAEIVTAHGGVRPVEQGEGDSFVVAFARAGDAVACALDLQRAPLAPIRLRIGVHTGDIQLRDEGNYIGPTIIRTARLRDLAHGGQTVLSGTTSDLAIDRLPSDSWLTDLGNHALRDLSRPERVIQLCHPDLRNEFPPLRTSKATMSHNLPIQLTSFVGREAEMAEVRQILEDSRLVTLTGAGGSGKTRLAIQIAAEGGFVDGVCYVDLAPITDPDIVPITVARALGLPDQMGRSATETVTRSIGNRHMLVVLDNCEHLLDASASLIITLLGSCPGLTLLGTSREPVGVPGEVTWRVPSLSLDDEAIQLFTDRARLARPDFSLSDGNVAAVTEICRRLDGMPLAIELAAARVHALSPSQIASSLQDRFRLLTGGARTAMRRQQTLRASVDWSHDLLTQPERTLFRRLAVFMGGFGLEAAQAVAGDADLEHYQVLDQLALLVDKSLVAAEDNPHGTRYHLLESVRQYAQEKLSDSGEADAVRARHRDYYTARAAQLDTPGQAGEGWRVTQVEGEIDNLRAAFSWSRDKGEIELAFQLASSLWPLWVSRGYIREGMSWFDAAFADDIARYPGVDGATWARALADQAALDGMMGATNRLDQAQQALAIAREIGNPALMARALSACASTAAFNLDIALPYSDEAIGLARQSGDKRRLSEALAWHGQAAFYRGDPLAMRVNAEEGRGLADAIGDRFISRACRWGLGWARMVTGDLAGATAELREVAAEAGVDGDAVFKFSSLFDEAHALAYQGATTAAQAIADAALETADDLGGIYKHLSPLVSGIAALVAGDIEAADKANEAVWQQIGFELELAKNNVWRRAEVALALGDLTAARRWADDAVGATTGWHRMIALTTRTRVAIAQGELGQAERDAHDAVACGAEFQAYLGMADAMECLAALTAEDGSHHEAARLFGAASAMRDRSGEVRFKIYQSDHDASVAALRNAMGANDFDEAWAEGSALTTAEAITYAQRGRGGRKRSTSGWGSLTPTERDVVHLVREGLSNKDIGARLFVSPRTVQTHLTHVYTKLELTSRLQLVQEAARHA
jgi:predicted ATPase/class 3 adenylate cyclase/DNA-binding CsgD family transcriptional regulator